MKRLIASVVPLVIAACAPAVVWSDDSSDASVLYFGNNYEFWGVGEVDLRNGAFGTGTWLGTGNGKGWMLTARHVLDVGVTADFVVQDRSTYSVVGRYAWGDVAIAEVTSDYSDLNGLFPLKLNQGEIVAGDLVVSAGYGYHGAQSDTPDLRYDGRRRGFQSVSLGLDSSGEFVVDRFDAPDDPNDRIVEGFGAGGDSGSMYLRQDGTILGVLTGGEPEVYGGLNYYSALTPEISNEIYQLTGLEPVPEPASLAALGLGLIFALRRKQKA